MRGMSSSFTSGSLPVHAITATGSLSQVLPPSAECRTENSVPAGPMSPVAGQPVALDRQEREEQLSLVVEGERRIATRAPVLTRRLHRRERARTVGGKRRPSSGDA